MSSNQEPGVVEEMSGILYSIFTFVHMFHSYVKHYFEMEMKIAEIFPFRFCLNIKIHGVKWQ